MILWMILGTYLPCIFRVLSMCSLWDNIGSAVGSARAHADPLETIFYNRTSKGMYLCPAIS